ncbi:hypothetical protein MCEMRE217_01045 [Candidatus Nanopelagicaceae bacterium]
MEILRFDDAGSTTPQRKKSSKGMLVVGLVATLFGISSAFASSTITINGAAPIALGQGVTAVTACDTAISLVPSTEMSIETGTPTFFMTSLAINGIDASVSDSTTAGLGCGGKIFDIQIFNGSNTPYSCTDLNAKATVKDVKGYDWPLACSANKLSFTVRSVADTNRPYLIEFTKAPSTISYITLVTRES